MTTHYDRDILIDYLHGALDPSVDAAVFAHLETCDACMRIHNEEAALTELLRTTARAQERELPAFVKARVWDEIHKQRPSWTQRWRGLWAPALALPIAAALALGVYFGVPAFHGSAPEPMISAALFLDEHNAEVQQNPLGPGNAPAIYGTDAQAQAAPATAATYIDTADAATLDDASGAIR